MTPLEQPYVYDTITLDQQLVALACIIKGGGGRTVEFQNQQAPGFGGAFTVMRMEQISTVDYEFHMWLPVHFQAWDRLVAMLNAGRKKRPPRVYKLGDLRLAGTEITDIACVGIGPQFIVTPGKWGRVVKFTEYRKRRPIGGPLAPKSAREEKIDALNTENKALEVQLAAAKAAVSTGT